MSCFFFWPCLFKAFSKPLKGHLYLGEGGLILEPQGSRQDAMSSPTKGCWRKINLLLFILSYVLSLYGYVYDLSLNFYLFFGNCVCLKAATWTWFSNVAASIAVTLLPLYFSCAIYILALKEGYVLFNSFIFKGHIW